MITIRLKKFSTEEDDFDPHEHSAFRDYMCGALKGAIGGGIIGGALGGLPVLAEKTLKKDSLLRKKTGELALSGISKASDKMDKALKFLKNNSKESEICKELYDKLGGEEGKKKFKLMKYMGKFPLNYIMGKTAAKEFGDKITNDMLPKINKNYKDVVTATAILGGLNGIRKARKKRKQEEKDARELQKIRHYLLN